MPRHRKLSRSRVPRIVKRRYKRSSSSSPHFVAVAVAVRFVPRHVVERARRQVANFVDECWIGRCFK